MLRLVPVTLKQANAFVAAHHRHHKPVTGHKFPSAVSRTVSWWASPLPAGR